MLFNFAAVCRVARAGECAKREYMVEPQSELEELIQLYSQAQEKAIQLIVV